MSSESYRYSLLDNRSSSSTNRDENQNGNSAMGRNLDKFLLLMWKNWLTQIRKPIQTIIEISAPVFFSILLVLIRSLADPVTHESMEYPSYPLLNVSFSKLLRDDNPLNFNKTFKLLYSPDSIINRTMFDSPDLEFFRDAMPNIAIVGFPTGAALEKYYLNDSDSIFAAVQLDDDVTSITDDLTIMIRFPSELRLPKLGIDSWKTNLIFPLFQTPGPRDFNNTQGATPNYYLELFLPFQYIVTKLFHYAVHKNTSIMNPSDIRMRRFAYGDWQEDLLLQVLANVAGILVMLSFVYTCTNTVKSITIEKEKQLKEAMKIMGLSNWLHWLAWFIKCFSFLLVSSILIVVLLKVKWYTNTDYSVFTHADPTVMFVFLLLYMSATITFCFLISVFFSKANTAGTVAGLAWFLSYAPYIFLQNNYDSISLSTKLASSLASNTAMAYGFQLMLMYEGTGDGIQWNHIFTPNSRDDSLALGHIMILLLIDTFIYLIIALYVEAVLPGNYGVPQKWYFPFTRKFWCGYSRNSAVHDISDEVNPHLNNEFFEPEPHRLNTGIQIKNLKKSFGSKAAVRGLSLNMYENQITVLLGHNGAGKTTTMSMLTGMFPPTSGTASVGGHDITTDINLVRDSLGLCPQHNILFDDLTVREHLYFFGKLKGLAGDQIEDEIKKYIKLLELEDKEKAKSSTLSGGMKRKLSVGVALCGDSKVVMLDEPTAGMDPSARRAVWDLLQSQKQGRTMLLTTHFMDEADLLGDRIAIMAGGELQCCGSSFFLKKKYGAGYHLIVDKSSSCDSTKVTSFLKNHISNIQVENDIGSELTYLLAESQSAQFEEMLSNLENNSQNLGIRSYGISLTTLEEVFLKVGADHGQEEMYNDTNANHATTNGITKIQEPKPVLNGYNHNGDIVETNLKMGDHQFLLTEYKLIINQFLAMFMKRILSMWRSWILQTIQLLMPVVYLLIALLVNKTQPPFLPSLKLTLDSYENPVTLVSGDKNSLFYEKYLNALGDHRDSVEYVTNLTDKMIGLTKKYPTTVRRSYAVGADITDETITAYFNNDPYHTPPLSLGLALNARLNSSFKFVNYPLPFTYESQLAQLSRPNNLGFQIAFNIGFSMAFVSSFYILFYIRERACKSKHLQFVSGVKVLIFWFTSLICDFFTFIATVLLLIFTLVCFQEDGFSTFSDLIRMFATLMYFAWSMLPMMYIASNFFDKPATGYTRMTLFSVFTGNAAFMAVQILNTKGLNLEYIGRPLHWLFLVVPHYSLVSGIMDSYKMKLLNTACETMNYNNGICKGIDHQYFKWEEPGIGRNLMYSMLVGLVLFIIVLLKDFKLLKFVGELQNRFAQKPPPPIDADDDDVNEEKNRIRSTPEHALLNENILVLRDVTKYYKNFLAVNTLCLGARDHECFGLLGVNGAGKTTTFKMMTGDVSITSGDAWVKGLSLKTNLSEVQKLIGYCPQFDALLDDMTARETLTMFALLRGVPQDECRALGDKLAKDFDFQRHLDKKVKELSGGNKRKLSTSIALIGDPPVIYLDEPTTGMDPATKRYLWNAICKVRDNGKCIVLTSHSMEECEALCTRLAIMVNGRFKCIGSTQHLKNKFAAGYSLIIKVRKTMDSSDHSDTTKIEEFVQHKFPGVQLREKHQEYLNYYITNTNVPWSKMFGTMELAKRSDLNIEDYSLGQCSLEQVFLSFTKLQTEVTV